jgi:uncharacterized coiled-coil protein SlyX
MKLNFRNYLVALGAITLLVNACGPGEGEADRHDTAGGDTINVTGVTVKGQSFMMPSPMQIADMIKKSGALYNKGMLNPSGNLSTYSDGMKRALNLGVYGADLGYITMYENTGDAMEYYKTVVQLGEQLKITGSFDKGLMQRFSDNVGKKDSILALVGEAYRRSDQFLRESEQDNIAALILAGGWIESMYFALNVYKLKPSEAMSVRIGEQKSTAAGIIQVLKDLGKKDENGQAEVNPEYAELIKLFQDLDAEYQKIEIKYTFAEPTHDEANKLTTINGKTEVKISTEQMNALTEKVTAIRNYIIK